MLADFAGARERAPFTQAVKVTRKFDAIYNKPLEIFSQCPILTA